MKNYNALRRTLGAGAAVVTLGGFLALGLELGGAFDGPKGSSVPAATDGVGGARNPVPNPSAPRIDCYGLISQVVRSDSGFGGAYTVNAMSGGNCATVYNPTTFADAGELTLQDGNFDACTTSNPNRLHVRFHADATTMTEGDVNLAPGTSGSLPGIPTCEAAGMDPNAGTALPATAPSY